MPLLQLLGRLRTLAAEPDAALLRDRVDQALRGFEAQALAAGLSADPVRRAHYALCDSLDRAVLNTPWGAGSAWARQTMVATFHPAIGPGRFDDAMQAAERQPGLQPVRELMRLCVALGPGSRDPAVAAPAGPLSAHWAGVDAPFRPGARARLPVWVVAMAALAVAAGVFAWLSLDVNAAGDALFTRMLAAPPDHMPQITREKAPSVPPVVLPGPPSPQDRLRERLPGVTVTGAPNRPVIGLPEASLFAPNSASLLPAAEPALRAVAAALAPERGRLQVLGFADDRPVRTLAFPSAFRLTAARAEAVRAALGRLLPGRAITAEGRGAADPVASNATADGRTENRRIEIVLGAEGA